jgi:hypothetical protein
MMGKSLLFGGFPTHSFVGRIIILAAQTAAAWSQGDPGGKFTIVNGQIYTPGLAIVDAVCLIQPHLQTGGMHD